jgi:ABC-type uncharacterized transport system permease subunit
MAKIAYRPIGLAGSMLAGAAAGAVVKQVWKRVADADDAPGALESEYSLRTVLLGAALQGLVFAVIKAAVDRGGARLFERATGAWPGD